LIRRYLLAMIIIGGVLSSAVIATRAFAANPTPFPFPFTPSAPPVNVDTEFTVASRVSFDPNAVVTITGAGDPNSQITSDFAQVSFTALDFKKVKISGVKILNHGSTNTIASLEVETPSDFLVDVKRTSGTNNIRSLSANTFAIPVDGALGSTPGVTTVDIELMYWNNNAVISPVSMNNDSDRVQGSDFWSAFLAYLIPSNSTPTFPFQPAYAASTLTVIKFQDTNRNGIEDAGEPRLSGWTILVYELESDGDLVLTRTGVTDSNGIYTTATLPGGRTWVIREVFPTAPANCNWVQIFPGAPSFQHQIFIANNNGATVKFGNALDCTAPLTVTKFFDKNRNGVQDGTDTVLSGWTIKVFDSTGTTLVSQGVTDATGTVTFNILADRTYIVREEFAAVPPSCVGGQWVQILPGPPSFEHTVTLTYPSGASVKFGNALDCKASIFKFFDENGNGVHDLSESGLQGWNIQIYDQAGTTLLDQQFTDSSGTATFDLTQDQTYVAREVIPDEASCSGGIWKQTFPGPPSYEHQFYLPLDGGVSLKFGNEQICPTERYIVTLKLGSLD
jgi:hypothetical protein